MEEEVAGENKQDDIRRRSVAGKAAAAGERGSRSADRRHARLSVSSDKCPCSLLIRSLNTSPTGRLQLSRPCSSDGTNSRGVRCRDEQTDSFRSTVAYFYFLFFGLQSVTMTLSNVCLTCFISRQKSKQMKSCSVVVSRVPAEERKISTRDDPERERAHSFRHQQTSLQQRHGFTFDISKN